MNIVVNYGNSKGLVKKYRGGGWAGAFGSVVDKKHMTHPSLRHKND